MAANTGPVAMDAIEVNGQRPGTLVVFRYHHRGEWVGKHPSLVPGTRVEVARLWDFAIDDEPYSGGMMSTPPVVVVEIGSAFDAAELAVVDPQCSIRLGTRRTSSLATGRSRRCPV